VLADVWLELDDLRAGRETGGLLEVLERLTRFAPSLESAGWLAVESALVEQFVEISSSPGE